MLAILALIIFVTAAFAQKPLQKTCAPASWGNMKSTPHDAAWTLDDAGRRVAGVLAFGKTAVLDARDFGFDLPPTAVVRAIRVSFQGASDSQSTIDDAVATMIEIKKEGATFSTKLPPHEWGAAVDVPLAGDDVLWNAAWTPAEINAAAFGVRLQIGAAHRDIDVSVDKLSVTVDYDVAEDNTAAPLTTHQKWLTPQMWIAAGAVVSVVVCILLTCVGGVWKRRRAEDNEYARLKQGIEEGEKMKDGPFIDQTKDTNIVDDIILIAVLAESDAAIVYKGTRSKTITEFARNGKDTTNIYVACKHHASVRSELAILRNIDNEHIVKFLGTKDMPMLGGYDPHMFLVFEFAMHGDLKKYISDQKDKVDFQSRLTLAIHISSALSYLHNLNILHRRVMAKNVLVARGGVAKLAGFSAAVQLNPRRHEFVDVLEKVGVDMQPHAKWFAPESIKTYTYTTKSDVWQFGITMWEIFESGEEPWTNVPLKTAMQKICDGCALTMINAPTSVVDLYRQTTKSIPAERPPMQEVVSTLTSIREKVSSTNFKNDISSWEPLDIIAYD